VELLEEDKEAYRGASGGSPLLITLLLCLLLLLFLLSFLLFLEVV
jgi:hypothetical protein